MAENFFRELLRVNKSDFIQIYKNKVQNTGWTDTTVKRTFLRYSVLLEIAFFLTAAYSVALYVSGTVTNEPVENLYAQKEIGPIIYFFAHFPENIFAFLLLWTALPFLIGGFWLIFLYILEGSKKMIRLPILFILTLNTLSIPLATITILGLLGAVKNLFPNLFLIKILFVLQALLFLGGYVSSFIYAIQSFRIQFEQPTGRAAIQVIAPTALSLLAYFIL